jgi:hypothetical protein
VSGALAALTLGGALRAVAVGEVVTLAGRYIKSYRNKTLAGGAVLDARDALFVASPDNRYPITLGGGDGGCFAGGSVLGRYDRTWSWERMHDLNNAGLAFENARFTVDGVRIDNVTDGIRPRPGDDFVIKNVWLSFIRDDCVENDHLQGGLVADSLLDGCYVAFSARPSPSKLQSGHDGSAKVWTIRDSLVRLAAMPGPRGESTDGLGHGGFFKWHRWKEPERSLSPRLALHGNVFMVERAGQEGGKRLGVPPGKLASCSNNVMVWLGPGEFPGKLPSQCFTVTTDRRVWDDAVTSWRVRHGAGVGGPAGLAAVTPCGLTRRPENR